MEPAGTDEDTERLRALFEASNVAMVFVSPTSEVIAVNPAGCALCGRLEADVVGQPVIGLMHPDDQAASRAAMAAFVSGGEDTQRVERRFLRPDGTVTWGDSSTQAVRGPDGEVRYLQSVIVDITQRREDEVALARLAAIVASSPDAMVGFTLDGEVTSWNAAAERLYGYSAGEILNRSDVSLLPPEGYGEASAMRVRILAGDVVDTFETTRVHKDGHLIRVSLVVSPIRDAGGEVVGFASVARDLTERERAEALFRALLDAGPDAVLGIDGAERVVLVNRAAEVLFDYPPSTLIGAAIGELLTPRGEGSPVRTRDLEGLVAVGDHLNLEVEGHRRDRSVFLAEVTLATIDVEGRPMVLAGVRDGTERQQAAIVASSPEAIFGRTFDDIVTSWNAGAAQIYGYTAAEMVGRTMRVLVPEDRSAELDALTGRVAAGESIRDLETRRIHKDGRLLDVCISMSPILDASGAIVGASAVARDVTAAKAVQDALRASHALNAAILAASLDCIVVIDESGLVVEFSAAAETVFGFDRAEVIGRPMAELIIPPRLRAAHSAGVAHYLATGEGPILGRRVEQVAVRSDGVEFPVELAVNRVDLPGPARFTAYVRDLTIQHRLEVERRDLEHRLQQSQRLEGLGQLAGGVAHDFNNLLGIIMNYTSLLVTQSRDEEMSQDLAAIQTAAEKGATLARQLLIFGRREPVELEVIDLDAVLVGMQVLLARSIGEHISLVIERSDAGACINADRGQVEQVILNLVVNARDAMPDGGRLTMGTRVFEVTEEYSRLHPAVDPGRFVELAVSDTGSGMTAEVASRIFEPFFTTKPTGKGTGLGLATAYGIAAGAGGTISAYSEPDIGTVFRVLFPAIEETATALAVAAASPPPLGDGERILLVEDDPALMRSTARILRGYGYTVVEASLGAEALTAAASSTFDLLLTDLAMPQMSGEEVARRVHVLQPHLGVLFMSGFSHEMVGSPRLDAATTSVVQKPFSERTLLGRVHESLHR